MTQQHPIYDLTIVGGGPVGMFAATYACMHATDASKIHLIESLPNLGGQVSALFAHKEIFDIPGFAKISGAALIDQLKQQLAQYQPTISLGETVANIEQTDDLFKITTTNLTVYTHKIILASGIGAFSPRKLRVPSAHQFEDKQILYQVADPKAFAGKKVVIAGGGDSAIDWALALEPHAVSTSIVHRREQFRALPRNVALLQKSSCHFLTPYLIKDVEAAPNEQIKIILNKTRSTDETSVTADFLLVNYGLISQNKYLRAVQLTTENSKILVDSNLATNIEGIYAVGDCATYPGRVPLIATGFGEVPQAVVHAMQSLHPTANLALHSTQLMERKNRQWRSLIYHEFFNWFRAAHR